MKPDAHTTFPVRIGRAMGRTWRAGENLDRKARDWLLAHGLGANMVKGISGAVKFAVFATLLYGAFWLGLLLAFAVIAAWTARNADRDEEENRTEWRYGPAGYGLYSSNGYRIDPHDPEDEEG